MELNWTESKLTEIQKMWSWKVVPIHLHKLATIFLNSLAARHEKQHMRERKRKQG